jgi:hypothetical protein
VGAADLTRRLALPGIIFVVVWGLTTHGKYSVTGDEPHYLMVAQSVLADGDIDLRNNYDDRDGRLFGSPDLAPELHARIALDGRFLPVHDIGLPLVLVPVYAAATHVAGLAPPTLLVRFRMTRGLFAYSLVSLSILLVFCVAAAVTCSALRERGVSGLTAALIVGSIWLTAPVISNAFLIFPEAAAILVTAWAVYASSDGRTTWTDADWLLVMTLGCLPWAHRKYALYAFALLSTVLWLRRDSRIDRGLLARAAALYAVPQIALAVWTYQHWGNLAGPLALDRLPFSWSALAHGWFGTFLDRENGLLWWAPAYGLLPAAWWLGDRANRIWAVPIVALVLPGAAHDQWWGGFSPAARFLVPAAPIVCVLFAPAMIRSVRLRAMTIALLLAQFAIAGYGWQRPRLFWPRGDADNRILAALAPRLAVWAPSLRTMAEDAWKRTFEMLFIVIATNVIAIAASYREMAVPLDGPVSPARRR